MKQGVKNQRGVIILLIMAAAMTFPAGLKAAAGYTCTPVWESAGAAKYAMPVGDALLVFTSAGTVEQYGLKDGALQKKITLGAVPISKPLIAGDMAIMGLADGSFGAYSLSTGKVIWNQPGISEQQSSAILYGDKVFIGTGGSSQSVVGFNLSDGKLVFASKLGESVLSPPAISQGTIYAGTTSGGLFGLDANSGALFASYRTPGEFYRQDIAVAGDRLLISPSSDHKVACVKLGNDPSGFLQWQVSFERASYADATQMNETMFLRPQARARQLAKLLKENGAAGGAEFVPTGAVHTSSWVILGSDAGVVVEEAGIQAMSQFTILVADVKTGEVRMKYERVMQGTSGLKLVNPLLRDRSIIACLGKGMIISIDRLTGQVEWEYQTGEQLAGDLVIRDDYLVIQTGAGKLKGYSLKRANALPFEFALRQNFPNPFKGTTVIRFDLPVPVQVQLTVHDAAGRVVANVLKGKRNAGYYQVVWNGRTTHAMPLAAGTYFGRLEAGSFTKTIPMIKIR